MKLRKETISPQVDPASARRHGKWYNDACGTAFGLELLGERWSLLIVRELMLGPRRFSDLRVGASGISAKTLTERLESLERAGVLQRRQLPPPASTQVYELTRWGYTADEAIMALGKWAARSTDHDPTLPLSPVSFMLSLRTMFEPETAARVFARRERISGGFLIGEERFFARFADGVIEAGRNDDGAVAVDFTLSAPSANPLAFAIYGKIPFVDLAEMGLTVAGHAQTADKFIQCFNLPEKIA